MPYISYSGEPKRAAHVLYLGGGRTPALVQDEVVECTQSDPWPGCERPGIIVVSHNDTELLEGIEEGRLCWRRRCKWCGEDAVTFKPEEAYPD